MPQFKTVKVSGGKFLSVFDAARGADAEIARHTVRLGVHKLSEGYDCYLVSHQTLGLDWGKAGFIVEREGDRRLRSMFNASNEKLGDFMVTEAIRLGAKTLNCPTGYQSKLYEKHGFRPTGEGIVFMKLEAAPVAVPLAAPPVEQATSQPARQTAFEREHVQRVEAKRIMRETIERARARQAVVIPEDQLL